MSEPNVTQNNNIPYWFDQVGTNMDASTLSIKNQKMNGKRMNVKAMIMGPAYKGVLLDLLYHP